MRNLFTILLILFTINLAAQPLLDIDTDNDGLIEVSDLETLNAIRYQLDGSGLRMNAEAEKVTSGCAVGGCRGYELTGDLDFLDAASYKDIANQKLWTSGAGWQPIGDSEHPFNAVFKTNNSSTPHTIFNLRINRSDEDNVGLFGNIGSAAEISGIGLLDAQVTGRHRVGGLVGVNVGGRVSNSYASGRVVGSGGAVGLLIGSSSGAITNSYADGEVSGKDNSVGGLVGVNSGNLSNSYAMGNVVGEANNVGGLVGDNSQGTISNSYASASVSGSEDIGGLVGLSNLGTLVKNYVSGKATGIRYVGGLVGMNIGGTVSYSYWDKTANALEGNSGGVGLSASELQSASAQNDDLSKPFYQWSTADWDFGSDEQYPILKYATGNDAENPACGPEFSLPNCGSLLLGQHSSLKRILLLADASLTPRFKPTRFNYHLNITPAIKQLQLIPIANNPDSVIDISTTSTAIATDMASGTTSTAITLDSNTEITIAVSAPNQRPAHYRLTVNYLPTITVDGILENIMDEGRMVILDASPSNDTKGEALNYQWTQSIGKALDLEITDQPTLVFKIPEDYVSEHAASAELGLTLEVSDGKATASQDIRIDIRKIDNGTLTVATPTPSATAWTAPKIDLAEDPDGVGGNLQYQWQSRTLDEDAEWTDIDQATQRTYTPSILTAIGTQYRVRIRYTDGQGYATTLLGDAATYQPEIVTLDFAKAQATESESPSTTPTATTTEEFKCETIKYTEDIDDNNNGLIEICDLEGLNAIRYQLDGTGYKANAGATKITTGCADDGCKGYELMTDLDFMDDASYSSTSNKVIWTSGAGWQPIGYYKTRNDNNPFQTTFDGNDYTISNLMINRPDTSSVGLFGYIASASRITNIGLLNVNIQGNNRVGGLVGRSFGDITDSYATGAASGNNDVGGLVGDSGGNITNSYATGAVSGGDLVGGLVGYIFGGSITNSYATGAVNGDRWVGGLVGLSSGSITNSYATGAVTGSGSSVGGLVGYSDYDSSITNSYATGAVTGSSSAVGGLVGWSSSGSTITNSYATGAITGDHYVGGLVGWSSSGSTITNSYATGAITGDHYVGGLVGYSYRGSITNSYATGDVTGNSSVGGLVGDSSGDITNSYATGAVTGNSSVGGLVGDSGGDITNSYATGAVTGNSSVGGLVGDSGGDITNSYWDTETSGITTSDGGIGKTTVELQLPTGAMGIYGDWSSDDWDFGTASQYPVLKYATNCGASDQPACGTPLLGQYPNLLANLELSDVSPSPAFDPYTFRYEVEVDNNINTIKLTAVTTASDAYLSISSNIDGSIISEQHSVEDIAVDLTIAGATVITIEVTQGNRRPTSYILTVFHRDDDDSSSLPSPQIVVNSDQPIEEGETASLQASLDDGSCGSNNLRCGWGYFDAAKRLLVFAEDSTRLQLNFTVPTDYVDADQSTQTLVVVFAIANDDGIAREEVSLMIEKSNNGSLSLGQPTLDDRLLTAPKIDLSGDADGVSANPAITYQWQREEGRNNWVNIGNAIAMTYTILQSTDALHRVHIRYIDGQGYSSIIISQPIRDRDADNDGLIEIKYLEELDAIRYQLDNHNNNTTGSNVYKAYELVADLDFTNEASYLNLANQEKWTTSTGWIPIGGEGLSFSGILKGNGHTISNLMINNKDDYAGLFFMISEGAVIDGVDLYQINVKGHSNVGGLVAKNVGGIIINSSVSGNHNATVNSIRGGVKIGGLVGANVGGYIINSYANADIDAKSRGGGLVGRNSNKGWIINSYAAGSVTANMQVGGLVGSNIEGSNIINSYAITVTSTATSKVTENRHIGNLVGFNGRNSVIKSSYWNNEINNNIVDDGRGMGKTQVELQSLTAATAIYEEWNGNVWDFGTKNQYPALRYTQCVGEDEPAYCKNLSEEQKRFLQSLCTEEDASVYCGTLLPGQRFGLQSLELNNAILIEDFDNETYSYKVLVGNETQSIGLTVVAKNPNAKIKLTKGNSNEEIPLTEGGLNLIELASGNSTLTIVVTDGRRSEIPYTLNVTRFSIDIGLVNDINGMVMVNDIDSVNNPPHEGDSLGAKIKAMPAMAEISYQWNGDLFATTATNQSISPEISATYVMSADTDKRTAIVELTASLRYKGQQIESRTTKELQIKKKDNGSITAIGSLTVDMSKWKLTAPELLMNANNGYDPEGIKANSKEYQWEILRPASVGWDKIIGATGSTYAIPEATPPYTKYRVKISYKDNQSYPKTLMSSSYIYKVVDRDGNGWINIYTADQLNAIRYQLNGSVYRMDATTTPTSLGCPDSKCNGYELKAHIDLSKLDGDWLPLGSDVDRFGAIFEGNHYSISNLTINSTATDYVGLFAATSASARISNVGLFNVEINANNYVGGLAGYNAGTIEYSHVVGKSIEGQNNVGGLVGYNEGTNEGTVGSEGTIENSHVIGKSIVGRNNVGGLVGNNEGTVENSHVIGESIAGTNNVGALTGSNAGDVGDANYATMDTLKEGTTKVCKLIVYGTIESSKLLGSYDDNGLFQCLPE